MLLPAVGLLGMQELDHRVVLPFACKGLAHLVRAQPCRAVKEVGHRAAAAACMCTAFYLLSGSVLCIVAA